MSRWMWFILYAQIPEVVLWRLGLAAVIVAILLLVGLTPLPKEAYLVMLR